MTAPWKTPLRELNTEAISALSLATKSRISVYSHFLQILMNDQLYNVCVPLGNGEMAGSFSYLNCYLLLCFCLCHLVINHGVMNTKSTENGKRLKENQTKAHSINGGFLVYGMNFKAMITRCSISLHVKTIIWHRISVSCVDKRLIF